MMALPALMLLPVMSTAIPPCLSDLLPPITLLLPSLISLPRTSDVSYVSWAQSIHRINNSGQCPRKARPGTAHDGRE
jgi:hypothetical protein